MPSSFTKVSITYVAGGNCIIKESLEKQRGGWGRRKSVMHFVYRDLVRIFLMWFHTSIFLLFSYVVMCYNVKIDTVGFFASRHSDGGWLGSKMFIRDQLL